MFKVGDRVRMNKGNNLAHGDSSFHANAFLTRKILTIKRASEVRASLGTQEIITEGSGWWIGSADVSLFKKQTIIL